MNTLVTAYCACAICCGPLEIGRTYIGTVPMEGRTIAAPYYVKPRTRVKVVFPDGTSHIYIVEDRTRNKRGWDIYFERHDVAKKFGVKQCTITVVP